MEKMCGPVKIQVNFFFAVTYFVVALHGVAPVRLGLSGLMFNPALVILVMCRSRNRCPVRHWSRTKAFGDSCDLLCSQAALLRRYRHARCKYTTVQIRCIKKIIFSKKKPRSSTQRVRLRTSRRNAHNWLRCISMKNARMLFQPFESIRPGNRG